MANERTVGSVLRLALAGLLGFAIAMAIAALALDGDDDPTDPDPGARELEPFTVAEVSDDPARFFEQRLWLKGVVADVVGPHSFVLDGPGDDPLDGLLVLSERPSGRVSGSPATAPLIENDHVWVRGELLVLDVAKFEDRLGVNFENDLSNREGDPVLVAEEIQIVANIYPIAGVVGAAEVADRADEHIGELAVVTGRVTEVFADAAVVLDDTLFVVNASGESTPALGADARVLGPIRRFDLDQLPGDVRDDVDDDLFGDLRERPMVVARAFQAR